MSVVLERLAVASSVGLVVDVQERLMPAIEGGASVIEAVRKFVEAMKVLEVPLIVTEQYPAGLGRTCPPVRAAMEPAPIVEKVRFQRLRGRAR